MRILIQTAGGVDFLPGLQQPVEIDVETLAPERRETWRHLVQRCDFFALPAVIGTVTRGAADMTTDTLTVVDDARTHAVQVTGGLPEGPLRELLEAARAEARARRRPPPRN